MPPLAGGIAHDLNNVLAPILLSIELFRLEETNPERMKLLDHMENSARHGANLVKQVLSFTRGAEGTHVVIDLRHLARDLQRIIQDTFPKNIVLQIESAPGLWPLKADATQLHQVLMNLCLNARDAMPPDGGQLTLGMRNMVLDDLFAGMMPAAKPGNYVVLSVQDTGFGIPDEIRERIFDPFFTTKEVGRGTGLGLGTVQTIVKGHGGLIDVASEPGQGATFTIYLPASAGSSAETVAEPQTEWAAGEGELLLVVDDEEGIRAITRKLLEHCGYRVLLAGNGAEAVALYRERGPEIAAVLTDMAMPVMDGPATIVALRSLAPAVKIVGSSGNTSDGGLSQILELGVQHFIRKPYTAEALLKVFAEVLQRTNEGG